MASGKWQLAVLCSYMKECLIWYCVALKGIIPWHHPLTVGHQKRYKYVRQQGSGWGEEGGWEDRSRAAWKSGGDLELGNQVDTQQQNLNLNLERKSN
ncbi:unnamed protein product [Dovyalis caffra]|uniref:Uncharacterized protein n=1 Tax=Dovyalis caffra TaxID=77055 RepID=A0AAV1RYK2_9ROSI|nr:unnamed protein product [Dovyalis caffra]